MDLHLLMHRYRLVAFLYIYIYMHTQREREREREREADRAREGERAYPLMPSALDQEGHKRRDAPRRPGVTSPMG